MKHTLVLTTLAFILVFGTTANTSMATLTATTGVSLTPISLANAYYSTSPNYLNVAANPGQIFLSFSIANAGEYFTLNSVSVDITVNGISVSSEIYSTYDSVNNWNRIGAYGSNSYGTGLMNQGLILVGCGTRNSASAYTTSLNHGDVWQAKMTYDVQGQGTITSVGTVTYIPTPGSGNLVPLPPQKIFLAYNQPSSFSVSQISTMWGTSPPITNPWGSLPAASVLESYRIETTTKLKNIFARAGVSNIDWTSTDSGDAIDIYFCQPLVPDTLYGKSLSFPDQFNSKRHGEMIVFVTGDSGQDAITAAHEIGHLLGLRHVEPNNQEVMQKSNDNTVSPRFCNAVSVISDTWAEVAANLIPRTHNPLYHLLRYVEGWTPAQLLNAGINPGTWDTGSFVNTHFSFGGSNLRLHNIMVFASGGDAESTFMLEQIPSATLTELTALSFNVPQGQGLMILASSSAEGDLDVISSTGDPFVPANQIISTETASQPFTLFRQDSPTSAVAIATATVESDLQSPFCNISMSSQNVLRLDFRGALQKSANLSDWSDVGTDTTSPHFIVIDPNDKAGFFRSKQ